MGRVRVDIGKVLVLVYESYKKAVANPVVNKPCGYALYEVWKYVDSIEKGINEVESDD